MNIIQIFQKFPTQESCIRHLEKMRWGDKPVCVYCGSTHTNPLTRELRHHCTENYPKIHTAAPDIEIIFSITSSEGLYSSKNRSTLYFDSRALMPCRI